MQKINFTLKTGMTIVIIMLLSSMLFAQNSTQNTKEIVVNNKNGNCLVPYFSINEKTKAIEKHNSTLTNRQEMQSVSGNREGDVLVSEDFSLFTLGTEDEPDMSSPVSGDDYYLNPSYTHKSGWTGYSIYQAGQTCAETNSTMTGFLNTPQQEMAGTVTISFRIKMLPTETVQRSLIYCSLLKGGIYYPIDIASDAFYYTHSWTQVSVTFENPESVDSYVQFVSYRAYVIDDIVITRELNFIPAPCANAVTNYSMDGFLTSWNKVNSADDYLLTVYRNNVIDKDTVHVLEGFDNINSDGTFINDDNPNYPDGWHINLSAGTKREIIKGDDNYISSPQALCLDTIGDTIILPHNGGRFITATMYIKLVKYNNEEGEIDFLVKRNGVWEHSIFVMLDLLYADHGTSWVKTEMIWNSEKYQDLAITYSSEGNAIVAIDNIEYSTTPPVVTEYMLKDQIVNDTFCMVTNLDPASDYYYYVKAKNNKFTSVTSNWVEVFGLAAPTINKATNITSDSYQANWEIHPKADYYEIHNYDVYTAPNDEKNHIVLSEDFSLVQNSGTPENPIQDENFYKHRLDEYTMYPDWYGTSTIYADGMIGSCYSDYVYGKIQTPEMTLNNDTVFHVTMRVWSVEGETVIIKSSDDVKYITFDETGFKDIDLDFKANIYSNRERLTIYTYLDNNFLIDYITVSQDISKNDKLYQMLSWNKLDGCDNNSYLFDGLSQYDNHSFAYDLYGVHIAFNKEYWSKISDREEVSIYNGINQHESEDLYIYPNPANDVIFINCSNKDINDIIIYDMNGNVILNTTNRIINCASLHDGMYVVSIKTVDNIIKVYKIIVKH